MVLSTDDTFNIIGEFGFFAIHRHALLLSLYIWFIIYKEHIDMQGTVLLLLYSFLLHWYSKDRVRQKEMIKGGRDGLMYMSRACVCVCVCGYVPDTHKI